MKKLILAILILHPSFLLSRWSQIATINTPQLNSVIDSTLDCSSEDCFSGAHPIIKANNYNKITADISIDKTEYLERENIVLVMKFKNTSDEEVIVKNFDGNFIHSNIVIKNSGGAQAQYGGLIFSGTGVSRDTFLIGEEKEYRIFLLDNYSMKTVDSYFPSGSVPGLFEAGYYSLQFKGTVDDNQTLESNTINFTVTKPDGKERDALHSLMKIYKMGFKDGWANKVAKYREFIYANPESAYMEQAFMNMATLVIFTNAGYENIFEDSKWFIDKKPNSNVIDYAIHGAEKYLEVNLNDSNQLKNYLNEIVKSYPETRASDLAEKILIEKFKK